MTRRSCAPSSAERWRNCPRSVALSEEAPPSPPSWHSARGHVLHFAASRALPELLAATFPPGFYFYEACVREGLRQYAEECAEVAYTPIADDAQAVWHAVTLAAEEMGPDPIQVNIEVQMPPPIWLPMRRGPTIDVHYIESGGDHGIIDYKFGRKEVASDCPQMLIYADTVLHNIPNGYDRIDLTIIQPPRLPQGVMLTREEVREKLREFVTASLNVQLLTATDDPNDYNPGSWCHFCPARTICPRTRAKMQTRAIDAFSDLIEKD